MEDNGQHAELHYGDLVYININHPDPKVNINSKGLTLFANGYIDLSIYAVQTEEMKRAEFMNCIFRVLPPRVDNQDSLNIVHKIEEYLDKLKNTKSTTIEIIRKGVELKKRSLEVSRKSNNLLNQKISKETLGTKVRFGEIIVLQHHLSKKYLRTSNMVHPNYIDAMDLELSSLFSRECFFKIVPILSENLNDPVLFDFELEIRSFAYATSLISSTKPIQKQSKKQLNSENNSNSITFPDECLRRPDLMESFVGNMYMAGLKYHKEASIPIKLYQYCSHEKMIDLNKKKIIKNGDFIKISAGEYYLSGSKTVNQSKFHLICHKDGMDYPMNTINTYFQVILADELGLEFLPFGQEITSFSSKLADPQTSISKVWIRHMITGEYLHLGDGIDGGNGDGDSSNGDNRKGISQTKEIPCLLLVHNGEDEGNSSLSPSSAANEECSVSKNSLVALKIMSKNEDQVGFLNEGNIEEQKNCDDYKDTAYYIGDKCNLDRMIKSASLNEKVIVKEGSIRTYYRFSIATEEDVAEILIYENYANYIETFTMALLDYKHDAISKTRVMNKKVHEMVKYSKEFLLSFLKDDSDSLATSDILNMNLSDMTPDYDRQAYLREFEIFDSINKLIYYLIMDEFNIPIVYTIEDINMDNIEEQEEPLGMEKIYELVNSLLLIVSIGLKDNDINDKYNSPYVRLYISCVLEMKGLMVYMNKEYQDTIKSKLISLLVGMLTDNDINILNQVSIYKDRLFERLSLQRDYELYYLNLIEHICSSKAPDFVNHIRNDFVSSYLGDEVKRRYLLPLIDSNGEIYLVRKDQFGNPIEIKIDIRDDDDMKTKYILTVLKFVNKLCKQKSSRKLWQIIIKTYPLNLCSKLLDNHNDTITIAVATTNAMNKPRTKIIDEFKKLIKNVHLVYSDLPFSDLPKNLLIAFEGHEQFLTRVSNIFNASKASLIHDIEKGILEKEGIKLQEDEIVKLKSKYLISEDLLKKYNAMENNEFNAYYLENIYDLLSNTRFLDSHILLDIYESMCDMLIFMANENDERKSESESEGEEGKEGKEDHESSDVDDDKEIQKDDYERSGYGGVSTKERNDFIKNCGKILQIISLIDDHIVNMAVLNTFLKINDQINPDPKSKNKSKSKKDINNQDLLINGIITSISEAKDTAWVMKSKLYELGRSHFKSTSSKKLFSNDTSSSSTSAKVEARGVTTSHKGKTATNTRFLEDKFIEILADLIEKGNIRIASLAVNALNRKSTYEKRVFKELRRWSVINNTMEGEDLILVVQSLLGINQIYRRIQVGCELKMEKIDNRTEGITKSLRRYFEDLICAIYDYKLHTKDYPKSEYSSKEAFMLRLESSKKSKNGEIPFVWRQGCIKSNFQKVMKMLNAHEILMPFIEILCYNERYFVEGDEEFVLLFRYLLIIMIIFLHNNDDNQMCISNKTELITAYFDKEILNGSVEMLMLFTEMMKGNKTLLMLKETCLTEITTSTYVNYLKEFSLLKNESNATNPLSINYIRSLPFIFSSNISKDLFNPVSIMAGKFHDAFEFTQKDPRMELENMLNSEYETSTDGYRCYPVPNLYLIWKELLYAERDFAKTGDRDRIIILQEKFSPEDFIKLFSHPCFEYHFELKSPLLQWFNYLYYKKSTISSFFDNNEELFNVFLGNILLDISAFIYLNDRNWNILIDNDCFFRSLGNIANRAKHYERIIEKYDLMKVVFMQFQYDIKYKKEWELFIYQDIAKILLHIITNEKDRFLEIKDKKNMDSSKLNNFFKVWFKLHKKLIEIQKNDSLLPKSIEIFKKIYMMPNYKEYHTQIDQLKSMLAKVTLNQMKVKTESNEELIAMTSTNMNANASASIITTPTTTTTPKEQQQDHGVNVMNVINKYVNNELANCKAYKEKNLRFIAKSLGTHKGCLSQLVNFISGETGSNSNATKKEYIFTMRLLRKIIEIQNEKPDQIEKPIYDWDEVDNQTSQRIVEVQNILNDLDIIKGIFSIFNNTHDFKILKECLLLSISLLYGGNLEVQEKFYAEFMEDTDNESMIRLTNALNYYFPLIFYSNANLNKSSYFLAQTFLYENLTANKSMKKTEKLNSELEEKEKEKENENELLAKKFYDESISNLNKENDSLYLDSVSSQDNEFVLIVLFFLQSLCEGHNKKFQMFLHQQKIPEKGPVHPKSVNILGYMRYAYHEILKILNINNIKISIKILDLLIEALQGEYVENANLLLRKTLLTDLSQTLTSLDNKIDLLPRGFGFNPHHPDFQQLKSRVLELLYNLVERSTKEGKKIMKKSIDLEAIVQFTISSLLKYTKSKNELPNKNNLNNEEIHQNHFLQDGLMGYIILKYLLEGRDFDKYIKKLVKSAKEEFSKESESINYMVYTFCPNTILSIEIVIKKTGQLKRLYFPKYVIFDYLSQDIKDDFETNVDRSNSQTKIEGFMSQVDDFVSQATADYNSKNQFYGFKIDMVFDRVSLIANVISVMVCLINMLTLRYEEAENVILNEENSLIGDTSGATVSIGLGNSEGDSGSIGGVVQDDYYLNIVTMLNWTNGFNALVLLIIWLYDRLSKYLSQQWQEDYSSTLKEVQKPPLNFSADVLENLKKGKVSKGNAVKILEYMMPYTEEWNIARKVAISYYIKRNLSYMMKCTPLIWQTIFFILCVLSNYHPIISALTLFDIVIKSDTVNRILASVYSNWKQFLWTLFLLSTVVFIYSLFGFHYMQDEFTDEDGTTRLCMDEYSCFLVNINYGLRTGGGIADSIQKVRYNPVERSFYFVRTMFDLSSFIICIVLLLNLIFGMIIDSFGDLRDEKCKNDEDQKNICFICGIERSQMEKYMSFDDHISLEHNKWNYLAYLIYLSQKNEYASTKMSDIENYVWDRYQKMDNEWIPVGRSLTLELQYEEEEKSKKSEIDNMRDDITQKLDNSIKENKELAEDIKIIKIVMSKLVKMKRI